MEAFILVVDDDRFLLEAVQSLLEGHGFRVAVAGSGAAAIREIDAKVPDLALLDISLPDTDGFTLCRRLRARHRFPIVMLTSRSETMDKVIGLEVGADDYLTKPFEPSELLARVRAHLRRHLEYDGERGVEPKSVTIGGLELDAETRTATLDGERVELTKREFELLAHLVANAGRVVPRESLFERNWGFDIEFSSNSLDVHIYRLRKKFPGYIRTMRGYGYRIG